MKLFKLQFCDILNNNHRTYFLEIILYKNNDKILFSRALYSNYSEIVNSIKNLIGVES